MEKRELPYGSLVQISPEVEQYMNSFGGFLLCVTENISFGYMGFLYSFHDFEATRFKDKAFLRVAYEDVEYVGKLEWVHEYPEDTEDKEAE